MDILLIGDESESMIDKYLESGSLYVLYVNNNTASVCVVTEIDENTAEIKNLATYPKYRKKGYATALIDYVSNSYKNRFKYLVLGTGENDDILKFYTKRGFAVYNVIKDFFIKTMIIRFMKIINSLLI